MTPWTRYRGWAWKLGNKPSPTVEIVDGDGDPVEEIGIERAERAQLVAETWIDGWRHGHQSGMRDGRITLQVQIRNLLDPERSR